MLRRRYSLLLPACFAALFAVGCGADNGPPHPGLTPSMLIENESQYQLRELRIHPAPDYREASNLISTLLEVNAKLVFYGAGDYYVTVFREKYEGGPILAFTTSRPLVLVEDRGYHLAVFDESFRLEDSDYLDPQKAGVPVIGAP